MPEAVACIFCRSPNMAEAPHINLFGLTQYDGMTSFFGGVPNLSQVPPRTLPPILPPRLIFTTHVVVHVCF